MSNNSLIADLENKILVKNDPFPFAAPKNFLPNELVLTAEKEFNKFVNSVDDGNARYQRFKSGYYRPRPLSWT